MALVCLAGCNGAGPPTAETFTEQAIRLESADVAADVDAALARGDKRFIGVIGVGQVAPGVRNDHKNHADYGVRVIENTSDVIESDDHFRLQEAALRYAKEYNQLLLERLKP